MYESVHSAAVLENIAFFLDLALNAEAKAARLVDEVCSVLPAIIQRLKNEHGAIPFVALELEAYLVGEGLDAHAFAAFSDSFITACKSAKIPLAAFERERGETPNALQCEFSLTHTSDIAHIAAQGERAKQLLTEIAAQQNLRIDFSAKPFLGQPGSGMHIHVHLEDASGNWLYHKKDDEMSDALTHSIGGLLAALPEQMLIFAPRAESYARFVEGSNGPLTISWGANNRSCAIRLPDTGSRKRIEHRVAGADADIYAVISAVLAGIEKGLRERIAPPPQVYGDARLERYGLPKLPRSMEEAAIIVGDA